MSDKNIETYDADIHDQEITMSYSETFDNSSVNKLKDYYKVEDRDHTILLKYLKDNRVQSTMSNHT